MQYFRVAPLNGGDELLLDVHVLTHLCVTGRHCKPLDDVLHVGVISVLAVIYVQNLTILPFLVALVKYAQHLVQAAFGMLPHIAGRCEPPAKKGYLHDDAVVGQAVHKRVGQALGNQMAVVVVGLVPDVQHWLVYVANPVAQQIDGNHGKGVLPAGQHVVRIVILYAEVLAETKGLGLKPSLLQLYENEML